MSAYLKKFFQYRDLLFQLVSKDIKTKYRRSMLGYLWSVLNPLMMMMILTVVFSTIFRNDIPNFPVYFLTGQLIFNAFSEATNTAMSSVISNSALIKKVYFPKYILPVSKSGSAFVNFVLSLMALVVVLALTKTRITWAILLLPLPLLYLLLISTGVGLFLSALAVRFRDVVHLYSVVLTALMYLTPIFYPITILPDAARQIVSFNPIFHILEMFRCMVMYGTVPSLKANLVCIGFSIIALCVGMLTFQKNQDSFILYL
ncbi:ABC transporter permease [Oscillibacter sp.]|uniref:ABC transporter permease n=1 Tax=Oscillibacter sp. TaxID=1945593 RepID=UPI0028979C17|nr:ABC transporter permease [Oscillibacter sp.]